MPSHCGRSWKHQRSYVDLALSANGRRTVSCSERRSDYGKLFRTEIVPTEDEPRPKKKKTALTTEKTENFLQNADRPRSNKDSAITIID